jgi:hypothetical protein
MRKLVVRFFLYGYVLGSARVGLGCVIAYSSLIIISAELMSPVGGVGHPVAGIESADLHCLCTSRERLSGKCSYCVLLETIFFGMRYLCPLFEPLQI